ncbi:MAG: cupin domain-containing protein [Candidatus Wildermuthbacteria bacterium]|nr:cupin domain-containing protein [Candidatus Wildermuthbacteria bacterium]
MDLNGIRRFPRDWNVSLRRNGIALIYSADRKRLANILQEIVEIPFGENRLFVALIGLDRCDPPMRSQSPGSKAVYYAVRKESGYGILLQCLPPRTTTSFHFHETKTEILHVVAGESYLRAGKRITRIRLGHSQIIEKGKFHQLQTKDSPSLLFIEIVGDPEGVSWKDHHYAGDSALSKVAA